MDNILTIDGLIKKYDNFKLEASVDIPKGYITGIIGTNGAGKTTLISSILNITKYDQGTIYFDGKSITSEDILYKNQIGIVMDSNFYPSFWTTNILEKTISSQYNNWSHDDFNSYLRKFKIDRNKKISSLSKGMQMKLMIATALAYDSKLLILDEPTSGLDPISRDELLNILLEYVQKNNHSVIFSTHITSDLDKIADFIIYIFNGRILYKGTKSDLIEHYRIIKGPSTTLSEKQLASAVSIETSIYSFKALVEVSHLGYFSNEKYKILFPTIEEIMIFTNKIFNKEDKNESN